MNRIEKNWMSSPALQSTGLCNRAHPWCDSLPATDGSVINYRINYGTIGKMKKENYLAAATQQTNDFPSMCCQALP